MATLASEFGFSGFGEFKPDLRRLANDGLITADGVIPVYGDYISSPVLTRISAQIANDGVFGLHVDPVTGTGYAMLTNALNSITEAGVVTDVTHAAGAYAAPDFTSGAMGCNFGTSVVMAIGITGTAVTSAVQYFPTGAVDFADMITSTFNPTARFCFPLRNNLFLAHCRVYTLFDGITVATHPNLVVWSMSDNLRAFGSANATPELTGCGYQQLTFDIGEITGAVGCADYGIIACSNGMVRVDGPPYTFRVVDSQRGSLFPYSLCAVGNDVYFWSPAGLARLVGGEGPAEVLGLNKFSRSLLDNVTGFYAHPFEDVVNPILSCSMAYDSVNDLLYISYTENGANYSKALLAYNIGEDRLSWFQLLTGGAASQIRYLRAGRQAYIPAWTPGRDLRFIEMTGASTSGPLFYGKMTLGNSGMSSVLQRGYIQFKQGQTTRVKRVRPVYAVTDQAAIEQVSVIVETTNKPYATPTTTPTTGSFSTVDADGWIVTPTTVFGHFHSPKFTITANANMHKLVEYQGFEYEIELGPAYGA